VGACYFNLACQGGSHPFPVSNTTDCDQCACEPNYTYAGFSRSIKIRGLSEYVYAG